MQRAKDTFYVMLRDGIAEINSQRTVSIRGVLRPGVLVAENELETGGPPADVFRVLWTAASVEGSGARPLAKLHCEIVYETAGSAGLSGMDRGRLLSAMDEELLGALAGLTQSAVKMDYSSGVPVPQATRIFWSDPVFSEAVAVNDRMRRSVAVDVWSYEEAEYL